MKHERNSNTNWSSGGCNGCSIPSYSARTNAEGIETEGRTDQGVKQFYLNKKDQRVMYKFSDFSKFLQKGDRVWFMYQADLREHWMFESNDHWIPFDDIWFYERDGVLYAADGVVLVRPIDIVEKFMEYETVVGTHQDRGEVIATGNRLKGQEDLGLNMGDVILFDPKMVDKSMAYKGKKVWAVDFDSVLCVL